MTNEVFTNLSLAAQEQYLIQDEILQGKYGQPGDVFMTTRALAELRQVSVVTAHNILTGLCSAGFLELRGKKYFLSHSKIMEKHHTKTNIIGLIIPHLNNEFFSSLSDAVIEFFRKEGYEVLVLTTAYSPAEERKVFELLLHLSVAGIISCVPTPSENSHLYKSSKVPCVLLAHALDNCKKSSVQVNSFAISQKVARHLIEEGYRDFLYVGTRNRSLEDDVRFTGFQMELKKNGFDLRSQNTIQISPESKADRDRLINLLDGRSKPVGVFCYHDLIAAQLYRICEHLNKRIPEDMGIVGFDDLSIATTLTPPLTTVQYRITSMADMAVKLLLDSIKSPNTPYDNYYVEPNLVIRSSSLLTSNGK